MYYGLKTLLEVRKTNYIQDVLRFESWTSHDSYVTMKNIKISETNCAVEKSDVMNDGTVSLI
jgi:hypothetical protein